MSPNLSHFGEPVNPLPLVGANRFGYSCRRPYDEITIALLPASLPSFAQCLALIKTRPLQTSAETLELARAYGAAADLYERHLVFFPGEAASLRGLARCLLAAGQPGQALAVLSELPPGDKEKAANASLRGAAYGALGEASLAESHHQQAQAAAPDDAEIGCAFLRDAVFQPGLGAAGLAEHAAALAAILPAKTLPPPEPLAAPPVNVGFLVSAIRDIRDLTVLETVAQAMDSRRVKSTFYGYRPAEDPINAGLRHCAGQWRDISECDPFTLAAIIEGDGIDVLIDIGGHGAPNHLAALALRPAPWQASWLGNPGDLGLAQIDADFVDPHETGGEAGRAGTRRLPLPHGAYCREQAPPRRRAPSRRQGAVAFGADIAVPQVHPELLMAWSAILEAVPGAILVLRDRNFLQAGLIEPLSSRFQLAGIADRIDVISGEPQAFYDQVDVMLAPFVEINPHDTIEALAQGVPVLALAGEGRHRRQSAALLRRNGLGALVAEREPDYIAAAVRLGLSAEARAAAGALVATALADAPVFKPAQVAAGIEAAILALAGLES